MRFDSTLFYHVGDPYPWDTLFDEMHETVELVDELGFTGLWLAEHHFAWDGWYRSGSNPLLLGADCARHSDRLRFGQCGLIVPDWHPIRLAEDIATFDQITRGRVDIGIAPGINSRACKNFHPAGDRRDRETNRALYEENVEILLKALTEEAWSHEGRFHTFPAPGWKEANPMAHDERFHNADNEVVKLSIQPGPYQSPRPPMWSMAESIPSTEWHARKGIGTMCQHLSTGRIRENWEHYRKTANETHGGDHVLGEGLAVMRTIYIAPTDEEAIAIARPGIERLSKWASGNIYRMRQGLVTPDELEDGDMELDAFEFNMKHGLIIVGSPETAIRHIEKLRDETNCQHIALFLNVPGLTFEQVKGCLRLFSERVMPRFVN